MDEVCKIMRTQKKWKESLKLPIASASIRLDHVICVVKRLLNIDLSFMFFNWVGQPWGLKHNPYSYSAMLTILNSARMLSEANLILENMKNQGLNPMLKALGDLISAYYLVSLIIKALYMFLYTKHLDFCYFVSSCDALLDVLVRGKLANIAQKIYEEMLESERSHPNNYSVSIMV